MRGRIFKVAVIVLMLLIPPIIGLVLLFCDASPYILWFSLGYLVPIIIGSIIWLYLAKGKRAVLGAIIALSIVSALLTYREVNLTAKAISKAFIDAAVKDVK